MSTLQAKIYFYLEELQKMTHDVKPESLQQRIPYETLSGLATTIAEGPIFEIIDGLKEVQQATEKKCFRERLELLRRHADEKLNFQSLTQSNENDRNDMFERHKEEIKNFDIGVIQQMDQKVSEQQVTLERAGVPGFYVTNNPIDVQVQMALIQFIVKLKPIAKENEGRFIDQPDQNYGPT